MITRIQALNYRSLRWVDCPISRFEVLVGPNSSGKSSFLDVIALLSDILKVGPVRAIYGDPRLGVIQRASDPSQLCWMRTGSRFELAVESSIPDDLRERFKGSHDSNQFETCRYEVAVGVGGNGEPVSLLSEALWLVPPDDGNRATPQDPAQTDLWQAQDDKGIAARPDTIVQATKSRSARGWRKIVSKVESGNDYFLAETSRWNNLFKLGPARSALANLPEDEERFPVATWFKRELMDGVQRIVLASEAIRRPSPPGLSPGLLPDGSNLPWIVDSLPAGLRQEWVTHLQTALPDLCDISAVEMPDNRHRYLQVEYAGGLKVPSWLVSDGTLRLLALTLLAYVPGLKGVYLIEEPENGIHPKAVETVFEALSQVNMAQVLCATHSPVLVSIAEARRLLCFTRDTENGTRIVRGSEHPRLREWKGEVDLGTYFASGVLE